jgi:hypothetical protein
MGHARVRRCGYPNRRRSRLSAKRTSGGGLGRRESGVSAERTSGGGLGEPGGSPSSLQNKVRGPPSQVHEHGEHPSVVVRARGQTELPEDARHVLLDGTQGDEQSLRDRLVRAPFGHRFEDFPLARRQLVEGVALPSPAHELVDDRRVQGRAALPYAPHCSRELLEIGDSVLEQIADALGGLREQVHGVVRLDVLRKDENARARVPLPDLLRRP